MMVSSFSTVRYLHRHIRSVAQGGSCFSTKKIKRQIRVTITGISQAVLYLVYDVYNLWSTLTNIFSPDLTISIWISFTVTTLYITGTTFNLGVGQAAFRLRVLGIWKKIKAMFGAGMVTNDVEIHSVNTRMDYTTCALINMPLATFNIMANVFFVFCMVRPFPGERIKQPLKFLLGMLIVCTVTFLMSAIVVFFVQVTAENVYFLLASYVVFAWSLSTSMNSSVWLNFFYYTQIVPAQTALFIWIKKNIKPVIYCICIVERIYSFLDVGVMLLDYLTMADLIYDEFSYNVTMNPDTVYIQMPSSEFMSNVYEIALHIVQIHFFFTLCVMLMSSGSTVVYLSKHMRRMVASGQCLSCPRFRSQVRVTVTGILQGLLYFSCSTWTVYKVLSEQFSKQLLSPYTHFTAINVYMTGTMFNLAAGQSVYRRRVEDIWLRAVRCCKVP
uniref:taste receptor, type 2, member 201, tandem duplicate 1 n=1 Tax=Semicossyphus pulcher TaxID=241346 RepID=UPI0037E8ED46